MMEYKSPREEIAEAADHYLDDCPHSAADCRLCDAVQTVLITLHNIKREQKLKEAIINE